MKKYRQSKTTARKQKLRTLTQTIKYAMRQKHRDYLVKIKDSFLDNPKLFWSYHKSTCRHRESKVSEISYKGVTAKTAAHKAELFNAFFSSVFTSHRSNIGEDTINNSLPIRTEQNLSDITIGVEEVANCLHGLDTSKASGPDGLPSRLLKECAQQIAPSLCTLFNHSLQCGRMPLEWKSANITPLHKKQRKEPAENYRPISLLPIVSKVLERCMYSQFYEHVSYLITPHQHGFLRNRSCVTQLLSMLHSIGQKLDTNEQTDIAYLAKAFDSVDHSILLQKLKCYGVTGRLLNWFADYLNNRRQRVVMDGATSQWTPVTSGVPQGSILGPMLFVIFINDAPDVINNKAIPALFADDTKLYKNITSVNDCNQLQETLTHLDTWSQDNNVKFNGSKCKVLSVTRKKAPISFPYHLGSTELSRVDDEKDLGVIFSSKLQWNLHINEMVSKANRQLGVLKRTCYSLTDINIRRRLYLSLVKSKLSYATQVWSPTHNRQLSERIERVQRRATKWILRTGTCEIPYKQRLLKLELLPLSYDREMKDLVFFFKALYGYVDLNINNCVSFIQHGRNRLSQATGVMLQTPMCRTATFQSSYFNRIVKPWNNVCHDVNPDTFSSPISFKNFLKRSYLELLCSVYDVDLPCTWFSVRDCPCHREQRK